MRILEKKKNRIVDAYVDGTTNSEGSINPYRDNKVTAEGYILELAYISNSNDVKNVEDNIDLYDQMIKFNKKGLCSSVIKNA